MGATTAAGTTTTGAGAAAAVAGEPGDGQHDFCFAFGSRCLLQATQDGGGAARGGIVARRLASTYAAIFARRNFARAKRVLPKGVAAGLAAFNLWPSCVCVGGASEQWRDADGSVGN